MIKRFEDYIRRKDMVKFYEDRLKEAEVTYLVEKELGVDIKLSKWSVNHNKEQLQIAKEDLKMLNNILNKLKK